MRLVFGALLFIISNIALADNECGAPNSGGVVTCNNSAYNNGITYNTDDVIINHWNGSETEFINLDASGDLTVINSGVVNNTGGEGGININSSGISANNTGPTILGQGVPAGIAEDGGDVTVIYNTWAGVFIETQGDGASAISAESNGGSTKGFDNIESGNGGTVHILTSGQITTNGNDSYGIYAVSNGGDALNDGIKRHAGDGGEIDVETISWIVTNGNGAHGLVASSNGGSVYSNDIKNSAGDGGYVSVLNTGTIEVNGIGANGIDASSFGGEVTASGAFGDGNGGDIDIVNSGTIISAQGAAISAHSGSDGYGIGSDVIVENSGLLHGSIDLSSQGEGQHVLFRNQAGGVLEIANGNVDMVGNGVLFDNQQGASIINITGDNQINIMDFDGANGYFKSAGNVDMRNGNIKDSLEINSYDIEFKKKSNIFLDVTNVNLNSADLLALNGNSVVGTSRIFFDFNGFGSSNPASAIKVVDVNSNINTLSLVQGNALAMGPYQWALAEGSTIGYTVGDWYVYNTFQPAKNLYGIFGIANASNNLISAFNKNYGLAANGIAIGNNIKFWSRGFGSKTSNNGQYANNTTSIGTQFGADLQISDDLTLSLYGGTAKSSGEGYELADLETEVSAKMAGIGANYNVASTPLNIKTSLSYGDIEATNHVNDEVGYIDDRFKGYAIAAQVGAGYEIEIDKYSITPQVEVSHTHIDFDNKIDSTGSHLSISNGTRTEVATSLRIENNSLNAISAYIAPQISAIRGGDYTLQANHLKLSEKADNYSYGAKAGIAVNLSELANKTFKSGGTTSFDIDYNTSKQTENISASANVGFKF